MRKTAQIIAIVTSALIAVPTIASAQMENGGSMGGDSSMGMSKGKSSMMKKKKMHHRKSKMMNRGGMMKSGGGM